MKIKICGITNTEDAQNAVALGADALGFIFYKDSPRFVTPEKVQEITVNLPPFVKLVGVFVNESKKVIEDIVKTCKLDLIQLHGQESPEFCMSLSRNVIKAFPVETIEDIDAIIPYQGIVSAILLDTKDKTKLGGTGKTFDWGIALQAAESDTPIILAGGISTDNIQKALQLINPYAVDICSSVECTPGKKDYNKMSKILGLIE